MGTIIVTTPDELRAIVNEALSGIVPKTVREPTQVEHQHRHSIDIHSNWFFFSWLMLVIIILGLFWNIFNQRDTIQRQHQDYPQTG